MFSLLKNKLANFISSLTSREKGKDAASAQPAQQAIGNEAAQAAPMVEKGGVWQESRPAQPPAAGKSSQEALGKGGKQAELRSPAAGKSSREGQGQKEGQTGVEAQLAAKQPVLAPAHEKEAPAKGLDEGKAGSAKQEEAEPTPSQARQMRQPPQIFQRAPQQPDLSRLEKKASSEKRTLAPKIGLGAAIYSFFSPDITIGESEVSDLLSDLELSLLEADVAYDVSLEVSSQLRNRLIGMKVPKGEVEKRTREAIMQVLESVMDSDRKFDFLSRVKSLEKPVKILFVGPNGAGKTTTMAKIARMLMGAGMSVVFAASDTFRAAAIEQTEAHAGRLGAKVIKSRYGADPASVAFDAINFARSHNIDVVLIDSAGRQDTNANLLSELKKINRVAKPDIKIYVGESIGGNSVISQINAFNEAIGMDGAILTKLDCDAKGGTAISIARATGIPVLFLGVGQRYEDLVPFDPHRIAQEIMA